MAVFDADPDRSLEWYGIFDVEAVQADGSAPVVAARKGDAVIWRVVGLGRAPRGVEVVLGAGAVEGGWPLVAVNENHVIALAVPVPLGGIAEVVDVEHATDVMAAAGRVQDGVVGFPVEIRSGEQELGVALRCLRRSRAGTAAAPLGVEASNAVFELVELLVVEVVVEEHPLVSQLAGDLQPGA